MSSCGYAELDGPYVLGALSPAERQEYEQHLATCVDCARSVRELAGLPGLLARVDPVVLEPPPATEPVPGTLLPALVREVRRARRRRLVATVAVAAAAAVAVGAVLLQGLDGDSPPVASAPAPSPSPTSTARVGESMVPLHHAPVHATVAFTPVMWGTRLDLTCSYAESDDGGYQGEPTSTYALVVRTREGGVEQVATWKALPGRTMRLTGATATGRTDITMVEVRTAEGRVVLTLPV